MELAFPDAGSAAEWCQDVADEVRARGVDDADPSAFVMLMAVGRAVRELGAPGAEAGVREHGALLYHLYHWHQAGNPLYLVDSGAARLLAESSPWEDRLPDPPRRSGYVQLPQHLFWARGEDASPAESVDGLFWTASGDGVSFLTVMGIRPDRPGFSVVPIGPVPLEEAAGWSGRQVREDGPDFRSDMPGADLDRLYELRAAGEALKLGMRALQYVASPPEGALVSKRPPPSPNEGRRPLPSALPYTRVTLPPEGAS